MSIIVPKDLPAINALKKENIFLKTKSFIKNKKDVIKLVLLNLMPKKIITENQFLRLIANSPLTIDITLLKIDNHVSRNTPMEHLNTFYFTFEDICKENFDALIVTGAPLGLLNFHEITYWERIKKIFLWTKKHVKTTMFVCWAVQAALNIFYKIPKKTRKKKVFGIFNHKIFNSYSKLTCGFDDNFFAPHSRYADFTLKMLNDYTDLEILANSEKVGPYLFSSINKKMVFVTGHPEYDLNTLPEEYARDLKLGIKSNIPFNYFQDKNNLFSSITWRSHSYLLFSNWINHYIY